MLRVQTLFALLCVNIGAVKFFGFGPTTSATPSGGDFEIYWNVPTFMCHKYGLKFEEVSRDFGIRQNKNDDFRGDKFAILYDPGMFPALLKDKNGKVVKRNGGVPQEGNLTRHLEVFHRHVTSQIPDESFNGLGIIDFESWRPIFRQNWASLQPYKDISISLVRKEYPFWDKHAVEREAVRRFEKYGKLFMDETLKTAKKLKPKAKWSYYAYPYCYNMSPGQPNEHCAPKAMEENEKMTWLFGNEDVIVPSVYFNLALAPNDRVGFVRGRAREGVRIANLTGLHQKVYAYYWFKYQDRSEQYVSPEDLRATLQEISNVGADGVIIWGSSADVNTAKKCQELRSYLIESLGPILDEVRQKSRNNHGIRDSDASHNTIDSNPNTI